MKRTLVYNCGVCGVERKESNHWTLARVAGTVHLAVKPNGMLTGVATVMLFTWSDAVAEADGTEHLCGTECTSKFVAKTMAQAGDRQ